MSSSSGMRAKNGFWALAVLSALGACNSNPLGLRKPQAVVPDPDGGPPEGGPPEMVPDGGSREVRDTNIPPDLREPDVRRDPDTRTPDARDTNVLPDLREPDIRWDPDTRGPDARDAMDTRPEKGDLGADRFETTIPEVAVPSPLDLLSWTPSVGGTPIRVLKAGHLVYLADWSSPANLDFGPSQMSGSIQSYEVEDPLQPKRLSTLFTPGQEMHDMALARRWLFAANDAFGIRLVDTGRPEGLQSVNNRERGSLYATSVAVATRAQGEVRQDYVLVGYLYDGGMDIHLVPDGGPIPAPIHYSSIALSSRCDVHQIQVHGDKAYLLASNGANQMYLEILDLSPLPEPPTVLGRLSLPMASHGGIGDIRLSGDLIYFSASQFAGVSPHVGGLRIIDVADATNPVLLGSLDLPPGVSIPWKGTGLAVAGNQVFYMGSAGVQIIDVSTPASPQARALVPYPPTFKNCLGGTAVVEGDLLYVGAYCEPPGGQGGLAIYRRH